MKINIVTPVYNTNPEWLKQAVASVVAQQNNDWKLILVDDGSTDQRTKHMLNSLSGIKNVQLVQLETNQGIAWARNQGLKHLDNDCEFVAIFDHDDIMYPERLAKQLAYFETHEVDIVGTQILPIDYRDPNNKKLYNKTKHPLCITNEIVADSFWFVNNPTLMIRRTVYDLVGCYSTDPRIVKLGIEDYEFITRCFLQGIKIHNLPEALVMYRLHGDQASRKCPDEALATVKQIQQQVRESIG